MSVNPGKQLLPVILALIIIFFLVVLYYVIVGKKIFSRMFQGICRYSGEEVIADFITDKLTGFCLFGIVIFLLHLNVPVFRSFNTGLGFGLCKKYWFIILSAAIIACIMSFFFSKSIRNRAFSPVMRMTEWYPWHIFISASGWIIYLLGYEFMLRGFLWFLCVNLLGFWPSLIINILVYSMIHIPKGLILVAGSIPVGLVLCFLTWLTGSFFPAFLLHSLISVSNEIFSIYNNPELRLIAKK